MAFSRSQILLDIPITVALTGVVRGPIVSVPVTGSVVSLQADFDFGADGTTAKAWVQTSLDGGLTWIDVANFAFLVADSRKVSALNRGLAPSAQGAVATDGSLADDTIVQGIMGDRIRVKVTTTGTYSGSTTLKVTAVFN